MKRILCVMLGLFLFVCVGCANPDHGNSGDDYNNYSPAVGSEQIQTGDRFSVIEERGYTDVTEEPASAFSLNCGNSAYVYMRKCVSGGRLPNADSVRIEEYINYFSYDVAADPDGDFTVYANAYPCPYNGDAMLMRITAAAREVQKTQIQNNFVFLLDTSGSMYGPDRLGLFNTAINYMAGALKPGDLVSVITYGSTSKVLLDGVDYTRRDEITEATQNLIASGGTAGANAIQTAYQTALKHFIAGGNNRIILFTDGDFNVGVSSVEGLKTLVSQYCTNNVYLSCIGVGYGNYADTTLQALAEAGNGNAYYADGETEIKRIFGEQLSGVLYTVACDCKASVKFNPEAVKSYRLLGYDNRRLSSAEFEDDGTNAGEIGSGTQVTAVYEIIPTATYSGEDNVAEITIKYKQPQGESELTLTQNIGGGTPNGDDEFIACVAEYALVLRRSAYAPDANIYNVIDRLTDMQPGGERRAEFYDLCLAASGMIEYQWRI